MNQSGGCAGAPSRLSNVPAGLTLRSTHRSDMPLRIGEFSFHFRIGRIPSRPPNVVGRHLARMKAVAVCCILVIGAGWLDGQVLSRRHYAGHGKTFPQIWSLDTGTLNFRQLTRSGRDHSEPVCSRDGQADLLHLGPRPRALTQLVRRPKRPRGLGL